MYSVWVCHAQPLVWIFRCYYLIEGVLLFYCVSLHHSCIPESYCLYRNGSGSSCSVCVRVYVCGVVCVRARVCLSFAVDVS